MFRFDFTSPDYLRDPATGLAKLRAAGPVVEVRFPIIGRTWITTTNEMAGRILKDHATFRMRRDGRLAGIRWWMPRWLRSFAASMLTMDEPDHTRLRSTVEEAFRRRASRGYSRSPMRLRPSCSTREVRPIWLSAMRVSCRCPSSVSCSAYPAQTGHGSSPGRGRSPASRAWWASCACWPQLARCGAT